MLVRRIVHDVLGKAWQRGKGVRFLSNADVAPIPPPPASVPPASSAVAAAGQSSSSLGTKPRFDDELCQDSSHAIMRSCAVKEAMITRDTSTSEPLDPLLEGDFFMDNSSKRRFKNIMMRTDVSRDDRHGALLEALAKSTQVVELAHGIKAISVDKSQLGGQTSPFRVMGVGSHVLFERSFYNDLLAAVNGLSIGAALIGSAGTSKSTWLYWYLYKVMQAVEQGINLPSNKVVEGRPPPELVVYQLGSSDFLFFLTREKIAYGTTSFNAVILEFFNVNKVVYLVEPLTTKAEPPAVPNLFTVIAASPDPIRYHEFIKTRDPLYMSTYEEEELVTIGTYLQGLVLRDKDEGRLTEQAAAELLELYSEASVRKRFGVYGGIIRRVLPNSKESLMKVGMQLEASLQSVSTKKIGGIDSIMDALDSNTMTAIGSYIVQWNPEVLSVDPNDESKRHYNFASRTVRFASPYVENRIRVMCDSLSFNQLRHKLKSVIASNKNDPVIPMLMETYVFKYLSEKPKHFSSAMKSLSKSPKRVKGVLGQPSYSAMEANMLYYPQKSHTFPAGEMYAKFSDELWLLMYGIQVSEMQGNKVCTNLALAKFLEAIEMSPEDALTKLRIVYCRLHETSKWQLSYWQPSPKKNEKTETKRNKEAETEALVSKYQLHDKNAALAKTVLENVIYVDFDENLSVRQREIKSESPGQRE